MEGYLRVASQLNSRAFCSTRRTPVPLSSVHHAIRHFSVVYQRPRPRVLKAYCRPIPTSRGFWWSSSPSGNSPSLQPAMLPSHERPATLEPETTSFVKDVTTTSSAPPEPIWTDASDSLTSNPIPDSSSSVEALSSSPLDTITPDTLPLQYGDLADLGLIGWNPAGLVRWSLEVIQVSTGMSWFWTIVAGTAFWRIVVLPLSIKSSRNSARLAIHGAAIQAASKRLTDAAKEEDPKKRAAAAKGVREAYAMAGVTPSSAILVPFLQIPVAFGVFFGIKGMCQFPVEQLKHGGLEFLPDLTAITSVVDPYYLLPIITVAMLNVHFKLAAREVDPKKPQVLHIFNFFRVLSPIMPLFMGQLPVGVLVSVITGMSMTVVTTAIMQRAVVRRMLRMPPIAADPPKLPTIMESRAAVYKYLEEATKEAEAQAKRRKP